MPSLLGQREELLQWGGMVPVCPCIIVSVLYGPGKPLNANPCRLPQLGDLRASPSGGSHNSWGARCVEKLFSVISKRLGITVGMSQG